MPTTWSDDEPQDVTPDHWSYKASQIVDANRGIFWGKYGKALQRERMVSFSREEIDWKGGAWAKLLKQRPDVPEHHWRKRHILTEWRWVEIKYCAWSGCEGCRTRDRKLGLDKPDTDSVLWKEGEHLPVPEAGGGDGLRCDPDYCDNCGNIIKPPEFVVYSKAEFSTGG